MKHGEGITLTLTGRCPILCLTTINNMAASGALASEKKVNSERYILTVSCNWLSTFFYCLCLFLMSDVTFLLLLFLFVFLFPLDQVVCETFG